MATLTVNIEDTLKDDFSRFCKEVGMNASVAVSLFARTVVRQNRIPFEIAGDPFYSEANQARLRESIKHANEGKLTAHELIED